MNKNEIAGLYGRCIFNALRNFETVFLNCCIIFQSQQQCIRHLLCSLISEIAFSSRTSVEVFFFFFFLGPHLWHMEVPRLGVKSELQVLAYTTATAT